MRVIFMGTPDFAVGTLEEIIKAGHEVVLVVSQPDKAVGRSKALKYTGQGMCCCTWNRSVSAGENTCGRVRGLFKTVSARHHHCGGFWADHSEGNP